MGEKTKKIFSKINLLMKEKKLVDFYIHQGYSALEAASFANTLLKEIISEQNRENYRKRINKEIVLLFSLPEMI